MRKLYFKSALRGFLGVSFWWLLSGGDSDVGGYWDTGAGDEFFYVRARLRHRAALGFAATATLHFVVDKEIANGRTRSRLFPVQGETRIQELVRMLGGGGEQARAMAAALLAG